MHAAPQTVDELETNLSQPCPSTIELFGRLEGDLIVLGAGGKMGPTLVRMARRATDEAGVNRRILAVSRFSSAVYRERIEACGAETIACDLLDEAAVDRLPDAAHVLCMAGMKFGASAAPEMTWAMNCLVPAIISRRYRDRRITFFSSGNVYGLVPVDGGGAVESDPLAPIGEYATTVMGRERIFAYFCQRDGIPTAALRLNYATELRYGVLVDLATRVWNRQPIDLNMGHVNVIWQADANNMALRALEHTSVPAAIFNIAGDTVLRVRDIGERLGTLLNRPVEFVGNESADALLNNAARSYEQLGRPATDIDTVLAWTADWVRRGGELLNKPTHFESREGQF